MKEMQKVHAKCKVWQSGEHNTLKNYSFVSFEDGGEALWILEEVTKLKMKSITKYTQSERQMCRNPNEKDVLSDKNISSSSFNGSNGISNDLEVEVMNCIAIL